MEYPYEQWYNAIQVRKSWRQYDGRPVVAELFLNLTQFTDSLNDVLEGARVAWSGKVLMTYSKGLLDHMGRLLGLPLMRHSSET